MKLLNFTLIKLTIFLVLGIVLAHYVQFNIKLILCAVLILIVFIGIYWKWLQNKIDRSPVFGLLSYACMMGLGILSYGIQDETLQANHYSNLQFNKGENTIIFKIKERLKPDQYNEKYIVTVKNINKEDASGQLLINIKKDSLTEPFSVDALCLVNSTFESIQKPLNPHQFDYSKYLALKQVYQQLYLKPNDLILISNKTTSIYGWADELRTTINKKLIAAGFKNEALSIMNALLLGQRQTIDKSIYDNYVNSGTIHILAVSGLHVGIILWILNFIFTPLRYFKYGNYIRPFILVAILWSFAVIAGLSPSVTRAVTMFSIISIAMHLKRSTNIYNTLVISAFFILLVKPTFLFEIGFQMSYLAVLGIVSVQPIIYKLWKPKYLVVDKIWQIFTVTLAAQAGVVPISLFYFHQFPGLFFISNLVVIPVLGLILGFGLLIIALALMNASPDYFVWAYSLIIDSLNAFIAWVAQFEDFLLRDIPFTVLQVICSYFVIVALVQVYKFRNFKWLALGLIGVICFQALLFFNAYDSKPKAFIVFNKSRYSMIGLKQNDHLLLHHNLDSTEQTKDKVVTNYKVGEFISTVLPERLQQVYQFKDQTILVIDSLGIYEGISFKPQYIVLTNSPKLNLIRVIDSLQPTFIIADASNYKSYVERWKATCEHKKIPFHYTNEKGAFILD